MLFFREKSTVKETKKEEEKKKNQLEFIRNTRSTPTPIDVDFYLLSHPLFLSPATSRRRPIERERGEKGRGGGRGEGITRRLFRRARIFEQIPLPPPPPPPPHP